MAWDSTALLASIKRRAGVPAAQATLTTAEMLTVADEQMLEYMVPLVLSVREDYWTKPVDQALVDGTIAYRMPYRALHGKLREVSILDAQSNVLNLPRVALSDLEASNYGFWLQGDQVNLCDDGSLDVTRLGVTLRLWIHVRPNALVETTAATTASSFNATAKTITLTSPPASYTGNTSWDVIRARPPFDTLTWDAAGTLSGSVITFSDSLPADLAAGDYVTLTEQSPVPQIPVELHGLLAQKVAVKILEAGQWLEGLTSAREELVRLEKDATGVLTPRVDGEALRVFNRGSLYRLRF